jgi:hypothetical protein
MIPILRPCFQRPEMLQLSLEFQEQNQCQDEFMTFFFADHPADIEIMPVLAAHSHPKAIIMRDARLDLTPNILEAYKWLFENIKTDYVAIIEDDIIVSQDWLKMMLWFAKNNKDEKVMAFNAGDLRDKALAGDLREIKYIDWYYSCASMVSRAVFEKYVLPHSNQEYYKNKDTYLRKHFPGILEGQLLDQAGLFRRIRIKHNLKVVCPVYRRFGHVGVYGRFQGESPLGKYTTSQRYDVLKKACHSKTELERWAKWKSGNFVDFNENTEFNGQLHFAEV